MKNERREEVSTIALFDSGSTTTIIQKSYLDKIISQQYLHKHKQDSQVVEIKSIANDIIKILFSIDLECKFAEKDVLTTIKFYVIQDIPNSPFLLLGNDAFSRAGLCLAFTGERGNGQPEIFKIKNEKILQIQVSYVSDEDLYSCSAHATINPHQSKHIKLKMPDMSPLLKSDIVLITGYKQNNLHVSPSRCKIFTEDAKNAKYGYAMVTNISNKIFTGQIECEYEVVTTQRCIPVTKNNFNKLKSYFLVTEARPYDTDIEMNTIQMLAKLPDTTQYCSTIPSTVYHITNSKKSPMQETIGKMREPYKKPKKWVNIKETKEEKETFTHTNTYMKNKHRLPPENIATDLTQEEHEKFYDEKYTIVHGPQYKDTKNLDPKIIEPLGYFVPKPYQPTPQDIVKLAEFEDSKKPYIEEIFLKKFPQILATNALSVGDLSRTLGTYRIRLRPNEVLPRHKRVFFMNPTDAGHLQDIINYLIKNGVLQKCQISDDGSHLYGSPSYLLERKEPGSAGRLIVDYRHVNSQLLVEPQVIPDIINLLHSLRDASMYSSTDLKNAYLSFSISEDSKYLTQFVTNQGSFRFNRLPLGMNVSCEAWARVAFKMIHEEPVYDSENRLIWDTPTQVRMVENRIEGVHHYFDDIFVATKPEKTYALTLKKHFESVDQLCSRIAFHRGLISFDKSRWAVSRINVLGWHVQNGYLMADPKRIEKIRKAEFPRTLKGLQAFVGLIMSLKINIGFTTLEDIQILLPLMSSKVKYVYDQKHIDAFNKLKTAITTEPIYSKLLDPNADKILFTDASPLSGSSYACILCQIPNKKQDHTFVPDFLTLDDPVHRIIYDKKLICRPVDIIRNEQDIQALSKKLPKTMPVNQNYLQEKYLGYNNEEVNDSFFIATRSIQNAYRCKILTSIEMRNACVKYIKKDVSALKLIDFIFNHDKEKYKRYIEDFRTEKTAPDPNHIIIEAFSYTMHRPIWLISTLQQDKNNRIIKFNGNQAKPPFIYGIYHANDKIIYRPYFITKETVYDMKQHKNNLEIVAYHSRKLPINSLQQPIIDHECYAILNSLHAMRKFIGNSPCTLLTDSRPLFMLFSSQVHSSSVKLFRWSLKLAEYTNITLSFIPTKQNISDFISKKYNIAAGDLPRLGMKRFSVADLTDYIPPDKTFTIPEWAVFVKEHPELLTIAAEGRSINFIIASLNKLATNLEKHIKPLDIIHQKMSYDNIINHQKQDHGPLYDACLKSINFTYTNEQGEKYALINDLIFKITKTGNKILLPPSLQGLFLVNSHLQTGHGGFKKMNSLLDNYSFFNKNKLILHTASRCYSCQLINKSTHKNVIGVYPIPQYCMQYAFMDLLEDLNPSSEYKHILLITCSLSDLIYIFPLKTKKSKPISYIVLFVIVQIFQVQYLMMDNGNSFADREFLSKIAAMGIRRVNLAALHPAGKGTAERKIGIVKTLFRKLVAIQTDLDWLALIIVASKILNDTPSTKTSFKPTAMLFGTENGNSNGPFNKLELQKLHPIIRNNKVHIEKLNKELKEMIEIARQKILKLTTKRNESKNKNRIEKQFKINDIVFCLDKSITPGVSRALRTTYQKSPYVIVAANPTTSVVRRISDNFTSMYGNDHIKLYNQLDPMFMDLDPEIRSIIKNDFTELDALQFEKIQKLDTYPIPNGIELNEILDAPDNDKTDDSDDIIQLRDITENINDDMIPNSKVTETTSPNNDNSKPSTSNNSNIILDTDESDIDNDIDNDTDMINIINNMPISSQNTNITQPKRDNIINNNPQSTAMNTQTPETLIASKNPPLEYTKPNTRNSTKKQQISYQNTNKNVENVSKNTPRTTMEPTIKGTINTKQPEKRKRRKNKNKKHTKTTPETNISENTIQLAIPQQTTNDPVKNIDKPTENKQNIRKPIKEKWIISENVNTHANLQRETLNKLIKPSDNFTDRSSSRQIQTDIPPKTGFQNTENESSSSEDDIQDEQKTDNLTTRKVRFQ